MIESLAVKELCRIYINQLGRAQVFDPSKANHHYLDRDFKDQLYLSFE
jgi:hypothetical protein